MSVEVPIYNIEILICSGLGLSDFDIGFYSYVNNLKSMQSKRSTFDIAIDRLESNLRVNYLLNRMFMKGITLKFTQFHYYPLNGS